MPDAGQVCRKCFSVEGIPTTLPANDFELNEKGIRILGTGINLSWSEGPE